MVWTQRYGGNKYGAKKTVYNNRKYDSRFEASVAQELDLRLKAGEIKRVEPQVTIPLVVNGRKVASYRADFVVTHLDGSKEVVEAKGMETFLFRLKWAILEATRSDLTLTLVKQDSRWYAKRKR